MTQTIKAIASEIITISFIATELSFCKERIGEDDGTINIEVIGWYIVVLLELYPAKEHITSHANWKSYYPAYDESKES